MKTETEPAGTLPPVKEQNVALFLDRDGVINIDSGYLHRREDFIFQEGIFDLCRAAQDLGYLLIVVTNQAGIARGYYTESDFLELTRWMTDEFSSRNVHFSRVYYCPYHPVHGIGPYKKDSPDRKPGPGMLLRAQAEFNVNLAHSVFIGDQASDIHAAKAAGVGTIIWLQSQTSPVIRVTGDVHVAETLADVRRRFFSQASDN
jgi:D-glycero-D-manno-heptose 1,7-bisphosphate phosphatase